ncbi:uncharacterized protein LOC110759032 [Prunus avium]|uniref:Uncharacterized protein LOC110759032 n=1 Tax=Prunus avium TaxID=42229 RepID=A0A6P5SKW8_PRUAV|nr:uncharacterized protein LOC110759032 [Prunus avium]
MRDQLSLFLIKNSLGAKMKKGLRNFCNDDGSTSTLNQHHKRTSCTAGPAAAAHHHHTTSTAADMSSTNNIINPAVPVVRSPTNYDYYLQQNINHNIDNIASSNYINNSDHDHNHDHHQKSPQPTLEEMILRLDLEEEIAARSKYSKLKDYNKNKYYKGRMSCVNNSDILRSARNALNQYPRFSLDGKDAMYRSSFRNSLAAGAGGGRKSDVCCSRPRSDCRGRLSGKVALYEDDDNDTSSSSYNKPSRLPLPATLAGESVVWCKPGVVAKLMGLEAMPLPVPLRHIGGGNGNGKDQKLGIINVMNMKRRNLMIRKRAQERHDEMQTRLVTNN